MKLSASAGLGLFVLLQLTPQTAAVAQIEVQARLGAQVGLVTPPGALYEWVNHQAGEWDFTRSKTDLGVFPVVGLSLDLGDPDLGFWLKVRLHRSIGLRADFNGTGGEHCEGWCMDSGGRLERLQLKFDSEVTEFGIDLVFPTRIGFSGVEPFFVAGLGIRHYSFDLPDRSEWSGFNLPGSGGERSFRFGGGLDFEIFGRSLSLSVMDTMADYWRHQTHHVFWELGIPLASRVLFKR